MDIIAKTLLNDEIPTLHMPLTLSGPTAEHKVGVKLSGDPGFNVKINIFITKMLKGKPIFQWKDATRTRCFHRSDHLSNT